MMRVSQRVDYALRALVLLAEQPVGRAVPAGELAGRLGLPQRFVEQQVSALARAGVVVCRRGAGGGCTLARAATETSVLDVVVAIEGVALDVPRTTRSAVAAMWAGVATRLTADLATIDLATLAEAQRRIDSEAADLYTI